MPAGEWNDHWHPAREETSSSISGRHFRHYKTGKKRIKLAIYLEMGTAPGEFVPST
jgi:hypothetical protein